MQLVHSAAGPKAVLYAFRHPDIVPALVLIDSFSAAPPLPYPILTVLGRMLGYQITHLSSSEAAFRAVLTSLTEYYFDTPTPEKTLRLVSAFATPFWPNLRQSGFARWNTTDALSQLNIPVLLIRGSADRIVPEEKLTEQSNLLGHHATTIHIPQAGHLPFIEQPEQTREALVTFLQNVVPTLINYADQTTRPNDIVS